MRGRGLKLNRVLRHLRLEPRRPCAHHDAVIELGIQLSARHDQRLLGEYTKRNPRMFRQRMGARDGRY